MNSVTELDEQRLQALVAQWRVGRVSQWSAVPLGIENSNFFVDVEHQGAVERLVLTVLEQPSNAGAALVPLLDACVAAGLPVPAALRTPAGEAFVALDGKPVMLCRRLPGEHPERPVAEQVFQLGDFLGRFHRATATLAPPPPEYPRNLDWLERHAAACRELLSPGPAALLDETTAGVRRLLNSPAAAALPQGAVHGDLFRDNALFEGPRLTGVLDFHHASRGWLIYDLAVTANDWCTRPDGTWSGARLRALLDGYQRSRPLDEAELRLLPDFSRYGALAFWLSRLTAELKRRRGEPVRVKDPAEFQRILEQRRTLPPEAATGS